MSKANDIPRGSGLRRSTDNMQNISADEMTEVTVLGPEYKLMEDSLKSFMKIQFDSMSNIMSVKLDSIVKRVSDVENDVCEVRNEQSILKHEQRELHAQQCILQEKQESQELQVADLADDVGHAKKAFHEIMEKTERIKRMTNIILHGIPEDGNAIHTITKIMSILCPRNALYIRDFRIGTIRPHKIRPVKIRLSCANEVDAALYRSSILKQRAEFTGMYVTRDLTPQQQFEKQERRDEWKKQQADLQRIAAATESNTQQNTVISPSPLPPVFQQAEPPRFHTTSTANTTNTAIAQLGNLSTSSPNNKRTHSQMVSGNDSPNTRASKLKRLNATAHEPSPDITDMTH